MLVLALPTVAAAAGGCESAFGLDELQARPFDAGVSPPLDADQDASAEPVDAGAPTPFVVASQSRHTCAVTGARRAYCWGKNAEGQLGDGTVEPRDKPVWVAPFEDVVDVSAGLTHSCLVRGNSDVYCWGKNDRGQLGDGTKTDRHDASTLTMSGVVKVGVGGWHTCAITAQRTVRCWGDNYYGALGDGTFTASTRDVEVIGLANVASLAVGIMHNCAATDQGSVYCWGRSAFGQLGYAADGDAGSPDPNDPGSPVPRVVPGLTDVVDVVAGEDHTCANRRDGKVVCWGRNDYSQLGDGTTDKHRIPPAPVVGDLTYAVRITAGEFNSCASFTGGQVRCWGRNNFGQLGNGNTSPGALVPSPPIVWLSDVERFSTGEHSCAWRKDGKLFCWGRNDFGQLGLGHVNEYELQPREVVFPEKTTSP